MQIDDVKGSVRMFWGYSEIWRAVIYLTAYDNLIAVERNRLYKWDQVVVNQQCWCLC